MRLFDVCKADWHSVVWNPKGVVPKEVTTLSLTNLDRLYHHHKPNMTDLNSNLKNNKPGIAKEQLCNACQMKAHGQHQWHQMELGLTWLKIKITQNSGSKNNLLTSKTKNSIERHVATTSRNGKRLSKKDAIERRMIIDRLYCSVHTGKVCIKVRVTSSIRRDTWAWIRHPRFLLRWHVRKSQKPSQV